MKSLEEAMQYPFECIDNRDKGRFLEFLSAEQATATGWLKVDADMSNYPKPKKWTRRNVLAQLKSDVLFGYEKASDERGISSSLMHSCVKFWNWVLEEGLENLTDYGQYGMPLFKETAKKYNWKLS